MTRQKLLQFIKKNPLGLSLSLHLTLLLMLLITPAKAPQAPEHIRVQTIQLKRAQPPQKKAPLVQVTKAPSKKKVATKKKAPAKKVPAKKPSKPAPKEAKSSKSKAASKALPKKNAKNQKEPIKRGPSLLPATSQLSLLQMLKNRLELPELGKVTLEITVSAKGVVVNAKVLSSESKKNEAYLLSALKKISFSELKLKSETCVVVEFGNAR